MKIKVIDIMNKIHNEETVPKKIMYDFKTYQNISVNFNGTIKNTTKKVSKSKGE